MNGEVPAQPAPRYLQEARAALEAILLNASLDVYSIADVGDALRQLVELHPLHVLAEPRTPIDLVTGVRRALTALAAAGQDAGSPHEQVRVALVRRQLNTLLALHAQ